MQKDKPLSDFDALDDEAIPFWLRDESANYIVKSAQTLSDPDEPVDPADLEVQALVGDAEAQAYLGELYAQGKGVEFNEQQALHYYRLAAAQHHPRAMNNLANIQRRAFSASR